MANLELGEQINLFKKILVQSARVAGFTGAGISTESGIPDYRSQDGIWTRYQPVYFDEFISSSEKRLLYWERRSELWPQIRDALPGPGHWFFRHLHDSDKLLGVITQNIDGLHEKSGLPSERIANLHGTSLTCSCLDCGFRIASQAVYESFRLPEEIPICPSCNGFLKPDTVSFGQSLRPEVINRAQEIAAECDFLIVMGSTLTVYPAAGIPNVTLAGGGKVAIINLSTTPLDVDAQVCVRAKIGDFLKMAALPAGPVD